MKKDAVEIGNAWVHVPRRGVEVACRDCGLVHRLTAKVVDGRVYLSAERLSGATRSRRRERVAMQPAAWLAGALKQQGR